MGQALDKILLNHANWLDGSVHTQADYEAARAELAALREEVESAERKLATLRDGVTEAADMPWREVPQPLGGVVRVCPDDVEIIETIRAIVDGQGALREENARLKEVQDRDRATLFGIYEENARLRAALEQIASFGHTPDCDGWYDDPAGRINPQTGEVFRFNSAPVYECGCCAGLPDQWDIARAALSSSTSSLRVVEAERLREIEWGGPGRTECPVCDETKRVGHSPGCWLAAAIKEEE